MSVAKILWVDDEIEILTSQIMFLENKGYEVAVKTNGFDAVEYVKDNIVDVVLLDETMPGITGLQTLQQIKELNNTMPVVLITKNEAENLMDEAIGSQISDYLIKPVNPNQVWLSLKKLIDNKKLISFDNLALEQLNIKRFLPENKWKEFYQGEHSFYINAVDQYFSPSSRNNNKTNWNEKNVKDYFKQLENGK